MSKEKKIDTEMLQGAPEKMSFEDMKTAIQDFKRLQKLIKAMPKEDRAKLMPKRERVISDNIMPLIDEIRKSLDKYSDNIKSEFKTTISIEKPDGQKWLTWKLDNYTFCLAINKNKTE